MLKRNWNEKHDKSQLTGKSEKDWCINIEKKSSLIDVKWGNYCCY